MRDAFLNWVAEFCWRRPWTIIVVAGVSAALCALYASRNLGLNANTDDLIAPSRPFMKDYRRLLDEFGDLEHIYAVVVNDGDVARTQAAVDALSERLKPIEGLIGVYRGIEPDEKLRIATRAMSDDELRELSLASGTFEPIMARTPAEVVQRARTWLNQLLVGGAAMPREQQEQLGAAAVYALTVVATARDHSSSRNELALLLDADQQQPRYFPSDTGRFYFITIIPRKDFQTLALIEKPLQEIRAAIAATRQEFPRVEIGLTGKPVLQADEMATTSRDMTLSSIVGFVLVSLCFMVIIGGIIRPALAALAFLYASAWTYGLATITLGQLNLLSVVFALVLVGIGFDFGVHVIARYNESRRSKSVHESIREAMLTSGRGNITSAITSSVVFLLALATNFQGLRELGWIAGAGLLLCLIAMTFVLPALLVVWDRRRRAQNDVGATRQARLDRGALRWIGGRPFLVLSILAAITIIMLFWIGRLRFEENLLELQSEGLESVQWEQRILEDSASASWFGAVIADTQQAVQETIAKARQKPTIGAVRSVLDQIQPDSPQRDAWRARLHERLDTSSAQPSTAPAAAIELEVEALSAAANQLRLLAAGAARQAPDEAQMLIGLSDDLRALADQMASPGQDAELIRSTIETNMDRIAAALRIMLTGDRLALRDALPAAVRDTFISPGGKYLVMMHPKENVWEYEAMRQFIADMREVDPRVTGAPISHFESMRDMKRAFLIMAILAFVVVSLIVWFDFRSMIDTVLAMLPLLIGLLWTIEVMSIFNISFNLANFFSVPILLGVCVDGCVHMLHRHHEQESAGGSLGSTRRAVILTALTTMIGFGALIIAHHQGLRSLGLVMFIGSAACLVGTIVVLPALLSLAEKAKRP